MDAAPCGVTDVHSILPEVPGFRPVAEAPHGLLGSPRFRQLQTGGSTMRFGLLYEAQRPFQGTSVDSKTLWRVRTRQKHRETAIAQGALR
jgi:hypothetical protein